MNGMTMKAQMSPEAKAACATSCEAALEAWAGPNPTAAAGYQLMRYARMGFLKPACLPEQDMKAEIAFLASLSDLEPVGPLPDFYHFLRKAKTGEYIVAS